VVWRNAALAIATNRFLAGQLFSSDEKRLAPLYRLQNALPISSRVLPLVSQEEGRDDEVDKP